MHKDHAKVLLGECPDCGHELRMHSVPVAGSPYWYASEATYSCECGYSAKMSIQTVARQAFGTGGRGPGASREM